MLNVLLRLAKDADPAYQSARGLMVCRQVCVFWWVAEAGISQITGVSSASHVARTNRALSGPRWIASVAAFWFVFGDKPLL